MKNLINKRLLTSLVLLLLPLFVQESLSLAAQIPSVQFSTAQDHKNMMDQLGIKSLRPGPSGNESAPNHAWGAARRRAYRCPEHEILY